MISASSRRSSFTAAALLVLAGIALLVHAGWWRPTAVVGLSMSTVLLLLYFTPWYLFILPVNIALVVGIGFIRYAEEAPGEGLKEPPCDAVDQVEEFRRMIRIGRPLANWSFCALQPV